jgi:hypothetical protein
MRRNARAATSEAIERWILNVKFPRSTKDRRSLARRTRSQRRTAGDFSSVRLRPHLLGRRGSDPYLDLPVTVGEATLGAR